MGRSDALEADLLILGLGNVLCADDGSGVAAVERLVEEYELPAGVRALDGGTLGLALLGYATLPPSSLEQCEKLEQLRLLQAGGEILIDVIPHAASGIDTPADYAAFVARQRKIAVAA